MQASARLTAFPALFALFLLTGQPRLGQRLHRRRYTALGYFFSARWDQNFLNHIRLFRRGVFAGLETALGDRRIAIWDIFASQDEMHQSLENLLASVAHRAMAGRRTRVY